MHKPTSRSEGRIEEIVMRNLTMEISADLIESGFATGNILQHTVVTKGLPSDAKLMGAGLNQYRNLELHFESEKSEGPDEHINVELTTLLDA